jgi:hypothetical protein
MVWSGLERLESPRARVQPGGRADWLLRLRIDGHIVEARVLHTSERDAKRYARRLTSDYTLSRIQPG